MLEANYTSHTLPLPTTTGGHEIAPSTITEPTNARSRRTRAALLASAGAILDERGFDALTMTAVADQAGVTRRAVYMHFGTRAALIGALFDDQGDVDGLSESLRRAWEGPDALGALNEWAAHLARYHPQLLAIDRAVERIRHHDADAAAHRERRVRVKLRNARRVIRRLSDDGRLASPWTVETGTDMLFSLTCSEVIEALIIDRGWSQQGVADHLALMLRATFTA